MRIRTNEPSDGNFPDVHVGEILSQPDYLRFVPEFDRLAGQHRKSRVLSDPTGFHCRKAAAMWEEIKFDVKHNAGVEPFAMVGDVRWQCVMLQPIHENKIAMLRSHRRRRGAEVAGGTLEKYGQPDQERTPPV